MLTDDFTTNRQLFLQQAIYAIIAVDAGAMLAALDKTGMSAAACNRAATMPALPNRYQAARPAEPQRWTLLHWACAYDGNTDCLRALLERGIDPNDHDKIGGEPPIFIAVQWGHTSAPVELLLQAGASANTVSCHGTQLLTASFLRANADVTYLLLRYGASYNDIDLVRLGEELANMFHRELAEWMCEHDLEHPLRVAAARWPRSQLANWLTARIARARLQQIVATVDAASAAA